MTIPLFCMTYNAGKNLPKLLSQDEDTIEYKEFIDNLFYKLPKDLKNLYVFGIQEICLVLDSCFKSTVDQYLTQFSKILLEVLKSKYGFNVNFQLSGMNSIGGIGIILISPNFEKISDVKNSHSSCGWFKSSLKGACGIRFKYDEKSITLVSCHLNANEGEKHFLRRNEDLKNITRSLDFNDGFGLIKPDCHCLVMGDFNYRSKSNPIINNNFDFKKNDELIISKLKNQTFWGFKEESINFKPTYKFFENSLEYNFKRIPSWCDRILFQDYEQATKVEKYDSIENIGLSDHKPVYLVMEIPETYPINLLNSKGSLIQNDKLYLKPIKKDYFFNKFLTPSVNFIIGYLLISTTTNKGRFYSFIIFSLIAYFIHFLSIN